MKASKSSDGRRLISTTGQGAAREHLRQGRDQLGDLLHLMFEGSLSERRDL